MTPSFSDVAAIVLLQYNDHFLATLEQMVSYFVLAAKTNTHQVVVELVGENLNLTLFWDIQGRFNDISLTFDVL